MKRTSLQRRTPLRAAADHAARIIEILGVDEEADRRADQWYARLRAKKARSTPLRRQTRLSPINRKRRVKKYERNFGAKADWIVTLPCFACGRQGRSKPAHINARGMGGAKGSKKDLVPLCEVIDLKEGGCHKKLDIGCSNKPELFLERHGIDLRAAADRFEAEWQERLAA